MEEEQSGFYNEALMEHRDEEMMVFSNPNCLNSFDRRVAHFLLYPTISETSSFSDMPNIRLCRRGFAVRELRSMFRFRNYFGGNVQWKRWARKLHSQHELTWKKAGIYEAIGSSAYETLTDPDVIIAAAEKWCSDTNTFMFPWGEATVTLEDVNVLAGFSVSGDSIAAPLQSENNIECERLLMTEFYSICEESCQVPRTQQWMDRFEGHRFEHEAFIALWLSRFVFPSLMYDAVNKHVIPIAVKLAEGHRVALAPPVLASVYRGLTSMKTRLLKMREGRALKIYEPLYLVQLWVWERFLHLQPEPNVLNSTDEPRVALWKNVTRLKKQNIRLALDTAGDIFLRRPYMIPRNGWLVHPLFKDEEQWISVDSVSGHVFRDIEAFVRCLRVSELVGFGGFVQQYQPNRVAMQFGFDQDIPKYIPVQNQVQDVAWKNYSKPLANTHTILIPSRISDSFVTKRYYDWWTKDVLPQLDLIRGVVRQPRSIRKRCKRKEYKPVEYMDLDDLTLKQAMIYKERTKKARMMWQEFEQIDEGEAMFMNENDQVIRKRYTFDKDKKSSSEGNFVRTVDYQAMKARNIELVAVNQQLEGKVVKLDAENQQLEGRVIELEAVNQQLEGRAIELEAVNQQLEGMITELEKVNKQLEGRVTELEVVKKQLEDRVTELEIFRNGVGTAVLEHVRTVLHWRGGL